MRKSKAILTHPAKTGRWEFPGGVGCLNSVVNQEATRSTASSSRRSIAERSAEHRPAHPNPPHQANNACCPESSQLTSSSPRIMSGSADQTLTHSQVRRASEWPNLGRRRFHESLRVELECRAASRSRPPAGRDGHGRKRWRSSDCSASLNPRRSACTDGGAQVVQSSIVRRTDASRQASARRRCGPVGPLLRRNGFEGSRSAASFASTAPNRSGWPSSDLGSSSTDIRLDIRSVHGHRHNRDQLGRRLHQVRQPLVGNLPLGI